MKELLEAAKSVLINSYSPYSNFKVSSALITRDKKIYTGVNIENASFGLTNCAERTCLFKAYSEGVKKGDIKAILIYAPTKTEISPCGACRQVIVELMMMDADVFLANDEIVKQYKVKELLPFAFLPEDLS